MLDATRDEADLDTVLRDWSLTKGDLDEVRRARGLGRLWTALHLCSLRRTGRFADAPERIPHEVIVHLTQQIAIHPSIHPPGFRLCPDRRAIALSVPGCASISASCRSRQTLKSL